MFKFFLHTHVIFNVAIYLAKIDSCLWVILDNQTKSKSIMTEEEEANRAKELRRQIRIYGKTIRHTLATTRFNEMTWRENENMRNKNPAIKCIYGTPCLISAKIPIDTNVFVLEMNNELDKIMGIGLIKNHPIIGKYAVYSRGNYNRFVYAGKMRIDREDMNEEEKEILKLIEALCFRGINHCKRGQGIQRFSMKLQYRCHILGGVQLTDYVCEMFKKRQNI